MTVVLVIIVVAVVGAVVARVAFRASAGEVHSVDHYEKALETLRELQSKTNPAEPLAGRRGENGIARDGSSVGEGHVRQWTERARPPSGEGGEAGGEAVAGGTPPRSIGRPRDARGSARAAADAGITGRVAAGAHGEQFSVPPGDLSIEAAAGDPAEAGDLTPDHGGLAGDGGLADHGGLADRSSLAEREVPDHELVAREVPGHDVGASGRGATTGVASESPLVFIADDLAHDGAARGHDRVLPEDLDERALGTAGRRYPLVGEPTGIMHPLPPTGITHSPPGRIDEGRARAGVGPVSGRGEDRGRFGTGDAEGAAGAGGDREAASTLADASKGQRNVAGAPAGLGEAVVSVLDRAVDFFWPQHVRDDASGRKSSTSRSGPPILIVILAVLLVVAAAVLVVHSTRGGGAKAGHVATRPSQGRRHSTKPVISKSAAPAVVEPTSSDAQSATAYYSAPSGSYTVSVVASAPCWTALKGTQYGGDVWAKTLQPGQSETYTATGPLWVDLGASVGVAITLNGTPVALPPGHPDVFNLSFQPPGASASSSS